MDDEVYRMHSRKQLLLIGILTVASCQCSPVLAQAPGPSLYEVVLFQPTRFPNGNWQPDGLNYLDVQFTSQDGTQLHGWYCPAEAPLAVVLYLHGSGQNLSHRWQLLKLLQTDQHLSVFIFDYRGYGKSAGQATVQGAIEDAQAARAQLAQLAAVPEEKIVLMGRSIGGAIAIQLAAEMTPRALVVESSFASLKGVAKMHFPNLAWLVPDDKLESADTLAKCQAPTLISHGDRDTLIPFEAGEKLFAAAPEPKKFVRIPNANHNHAQSRFYYKTLMDFLRELPDSE